MSCNCNGETMVVEIFRNFNDVKINNFLISFNFNFKVIEKRLRELAFLNTGISIVLTDKRQSEDININFKYDGGIKEYVKYLNEGKNLINSNHLFNSPIIFIFFKFKN